MTNDKEIKKAKELKTEEQVNNFLVPLGYRPLKVRDPGGGTYYNWGIGTKIYSRKRALEIEINKAKKAKVAQEAKDIEKPDA